MTAQRLQGRVALITGAGRGIGRAIALRFAREGASIAAVARSKDELSSLIEEVTASGGHVVSLPVDLSDRAQTQTVVPRCLEAFGTIDILVNNAGVGSASGLKSLVEFEDDFWDLTLAVNLTAPYLLMKSALPVMIAKGRGRIINIASLAGKIGLVHGAAYAASKHGLLGLTRSAALELAKQGVTVNAICPGPVRSRMNDVRLRHDAERLGISAAEMERQWTPIGRRLEPEEITGTALLLASDESAAITGQAINVCGGALMI